MNNIRKFFFNIIKIEDEFSENLRKISRKKFIIFLSVGNGRIVIPALPTPPPPSHLLLTLITRSDSEEAY